MKNKIEISLAISLTMAVLFAVPIMARHYSEEIEFDSAASYGLFETLDSINKNLKTHEIIVTEIKDNITSSIKDLLIKTSLERDYEKFDKAYNLLLKNESRNEIAFNALEELINMPEGSEGFNYLFYNVETRGNVKISAAQKAHFLEEAMILHTSDVDLFVGIFQFLTPESITKHFEASLLLEYTTKEDMAFYTTHLLNLLNHNADELKATLGKQKVPLIAYWAYYYSKIDNSKYLDYVQILIDYGANLDTVVVNNKTVRDFINESPIEEVRNLLK
ncbi:MAG: hypothetical protein J5594_05575 [Elusimicrobiaceae bacterium]|nr:hypothetical protein [Elusimicrobiaceae bacterium]